ncbi:GNAT family N-acetyltransferase [Methanobrevibacter sp.]|uniref:GNAT family N-acetyltransferase n=1 Tax=Methanobrevibacter sp. TaxID=66852 RepID=UPI00388F2464
MNVQIKALTYDAHQIKNLQKFLFKQIKNEFGYGYIPEYHEDIVKLDEYYIFPSRNNFFIATNKETGEILATIGLRGYDKDFDEFKNMYSNESTASIWRLFVDEKYRRCGLASLMFNIAEKFAYNSNYNEIYLHTHKTLDGALQFWKKMGFEVTIDTNNELQTVHMEKRIYNVNFINQLAMYKHAIKL